MIQKIDGLNAMTMAIFVHKMFNLKVFREKDRDMDKDIERD